MKNVTFLNPVTGLVAVLFSLSLFAAETVVDDFTDVDNVNALGGEWSYYDDAIGSGKSGRLQARQDIGIQGSKINVSSTPKPLPTGGFDYNSKVYVFETQDVDGEQYAYMPFTFGEKWLDSTSGAVEAFVGISTSFSAEGEVMDLTGFSGVKFNIKSSSHDLKVTFIIETSDIEADSLYAYHQRVFNVTMGAWNEIAVPIAGLSQPAWTPETAKKPFDPTKAVRLSWQVTRSQNPGLEDLAMDELSIDDVILTDAPIAVRNGRFVITNPQQTFKAVYNDGVFHLMGETVQKMDVGSFCLFDVSGKAILIREVVFNSGEKCIVEGLHLPKGMYFAQLHGIRGDGKSVAANASLHIIR